MKEKFIVPCNVLKKCVPQSEVHGPFHCQGTRAYAGNLPELQGKMHEHSSGSPEPLKQSSGSGLDNNPDYLFCRKRSKLTLEKRGKY